MFTKSIFKTKNLQSPEVIFNMIGNHLFKKEWSNLPLQILNGSINKNQFRKAPKKFERNKYMALQTLEKFEVYLKGKDVTIYTTKKFLDEDDQTSEFIEYLNNDFSIPRSGLHLQDQERCADKYPIITGRRNFWVEMPKDKNPMAFKKSGQKEEHDIEYLRKILPDVIKSIPNKRFSCESVEGAYKDFFEGTNINPPSRSWINRNMQDEVNKLKEQFHK